MTHKGKIVSGQTVLIIVLVMAVALTVGLSLINRTTTDIRVTSQFEDSARAFSAAEAGIEQSLSTLSATSGTYTDGTIYTSSVSDIGTNPASPYQLPLTTTKIGQVGTIFLLGRTNGLLDWNKPYSGTFITLCWKQVNESSSIPAIEVIYNARSAVDVDVYSTKRAAFDSIDTRLNGFTKAGSIDTCNALGSGYVGTVITVSPATAMLRVRPYYSDAIVYVYGDGNPLPSQGNTVTSTGSIPGGATRKITVVRQYKTAPPIFDYVLYSMSDINK